MANVNTKAHVLVRDGFRCRYCDTRLYLGQAIKVLDWHEPGLDLYDPHGRREPLRCCWATVDHIVPETEGGMDILDNLVACCVACNSRKGDTRKPTPPPRQLSDDWDGLSSIFLALAPQYDDRLTVEDRKWLTALQREKVVPSLAHMKDLVAALREVMAKARVPEWDST